MTLPFLHVLLVGTKARHRLEADHGALKRLINLARGLKTLSHASATIKGFEVIRNDPQAAVPYA
jgi:transposase, IS6 family